MKKVGLKATKMMLILVYTLSADDIVASLMKSFEGQLQDIFHFSHF